MAHDFTVAWSGTMQRSGQAPSLSGYQLARGGPLADGGAARAREAPGAADDLARASVPADAGLPADATPRTRGAAAARSRARTTRTSRSTSAWARPTCGGSCSRRTARRRRRPRERRRAGLPALRQRAAHLVRRPRAVVVRDACRTPRARVRPALAAGHPAAAGAAGWPRDPRRARDWRGRVSRWKFGPRAE